ncbi:MAG: beta-CASP ribonuclease aCPSF1 [Candidatus Baldrarchaeia archaeon]
MSKERSNDVYSNIKDEILKCLPPVAQVTVIEFEGPEVAVYSRNPSILIEGEDLLKEIAKKIKKRIVLRSDPKVRMEKEKTEQIIREIVPPEAEIEHIYFDDVLGEVIIEAKKPGLVIGKGGSTLKEIILKTSWRPTVMRSPPIESKIIKQNRALLRARSEERKMILRNIGLRIHRAVISSKDEWVRIVCLGGFREVGRSAILVQTPESNILLDCGVNVGSSTRAFPHLDAPEFDLENLDAVILSHAHLDHAGFVPFLFKYGYNGPIYCTRPTRELMMLLLRDYIEVARKEGKLVPFTLKDVAKALIHTIPLEYGEVTDITPDVRLTFHNAGHILGSAIVHLHIGEGLHNIVYTGDFKYAKTKLLEPANWRGIPRIETLIMESTYGAPDDVMPPRYEAEKRLVDVINRTIRRGGKVLIPVLAVGRAQEIMLVIEEYMRKGELLEVPVYIDGMVWEATAIHTAFPEYLARDLREKIFHQGYNPFLADCFTQAKDRDEILEDKPCIILATSGMLTGGPSVEYFRLLAPDPRNSIIFVSYQVEGTLGRRVQKGWQEIPMQVIDETLRETRTEIIKVNMEVHTIEGFSGHSDRQQLLKFVDELTRNSGRNKERRYHIEKIIICHGESSKCLSLGATIEKKLRGRIDVAVPHNLESIRLH